MGGCCGKGKPKDDKEDKLIGSMSPSSPQQNIVPKGSPTSPKPDVVYEKSVSKGGENEKSISGSNNKSSESIRSNPHKETKKSLYKSDTDDDHEEKKLLDDEKLEKESKRNIRGGDSAYGKVVKKNKAETKDFKFVKEYLAERNYQLIASIGAGNYAEVYKAYHGIKGKYVAVKVIELRKTNDNYRRNFLPKEIKVLRKLKHSSIVKIYEISQNANKIFMIMEFAVNGTMADWLKRCGAMNETTAWDVFKKIFESLHYMHSLKCAHRDLKLENILLTDGYNPKLSDFSYAIIVEDNALSHTYCGSLPYFAPEIMMRKPYNPFQTDIWSLGICVYIMVNDGLPFPVDDDRAMLHKQLNKDWDFKKRTTGKLSKEIKAMVRKMLEPDGAHRHTTKTLMTDPWVTSPPHTVAAE